MTLKLFGSRSIKNFQRQKFRKKLLYDERFTSLYKKRRLSRSSKCTCSVTRCSEMAVRKNSRTRFSIPIKITYSESASKIISFHQRKFFFEPIFFPASPLPAGFPVLPVSNYRFIFSHTRVSTRRVGCHWNFENRNSGSNFMNFFLVRDFCEIFSQISRR